MKYQEFLKRKAIKSQNVGFDVPVDQINPMAFDWQKELVRWSLYKGRAALFEDCGLGKSLQSLEWAKWVCNETGGNVLLLAPLAVSSQTKREGRKFGIETNIADSDDDIKPGINITNYEKLHKFDPSIFSGVVLDESSIIKNFSGKLRNQIIESFQETPYKLACTATPSPNDYTELGNTAEFLGVMTRSEMLSMFFINDSGKTGTWRLKGHVQDNVFWEWLCSWAVMIQRPTDIGFDNNGFILPPLEIHDHVIKYDGPRHTLFVEEAKTLSERRNARVESLADRVDRAARLVNNSDKNWLVWCNLNSESEALTRAIDSAVEVKGADSSDHKEKALMDFADDKIKCLVTKPSIAGHGMNLQNCSDMVFVGLSDSFEQYYQAVRRCWRFGQKSTVHAHIVIGEREGAVVANIKRKEKDMQNMFSGMLVHMRDILKLELRHTTRQTTKYEPEVDMKLPDFLKGAA